MVTGAWFGLASLIAMFFADCRTSQGLMGFLSILMHLESLSLESIEMSSGSCWAQLHNC